MKVFNNISLTEAEGILNDYDLERSLGDTKENDYNGKLEIDGSYIYVDKLNIDIHYAMQYYRSDETNEYEYDKEYFVIKNHETKEGISIEDGSDLISAINNFSRVDIDYIKEKLTCTIFIDV